MHLEDLISAFVELARRDPSASFAWTTIGCNHSIKVVASSAETGREFRALLNDAGACVAESPSNPGENAEQRFIVEVFGRAKELIALIPGPAGNPPYGIDPETGERFIVTKRSIPNAARAAVLALQRMKTTLPLPGAMQGGWRARPFDDPGPTNPPSKRDDAVIDAVLRVEPKWDGDNWDMVLAVLRRDGLTDMQIRAMTLSQVRQHFAVGYLAILDKLGGHPDTAVNMIVGTEPVAALLAVTADERAAPATQQAAQQTAKKEGPTPQRKPTKCSRPVTRGHAAEHWFDMDKRTFDAAITSGIYAAEQSSTNMWRFDLEEIKRPAALEDADPEKQKKGAKARRTAQN